MVRMRLADFKRRGIADYGNLTLSDRCNADGSAVVVRLYFDETARRAFQVDTQNGLYREADTSKGVTSYGEWKILEGT